MKEQKDRKAHKTVRIMLVSFAVMFVMILVPAVVQLLAVIALFLNR